MGITEHEAILQLKDITQVFQAEDREEVDHMFYNQLTLDDIRENLQEFNCVIGEIKQISEKVTETHEEFIFETIRPYCEDVDQMKISKRDLEQALLKYYGKNNLGVDCVARQDVERFIEGFINEYTPEEELEFINLELDGLKHIPPVTPQEPKTGHWILTDVEGNRVWHCNCSECGKDPLDYIGGSENWWLIKSKLPKYCPNCGSDNREVEE